MGTPATVPGRPLKALKLSMSQVKENLSRSIPTQIDQGKNAATMSGIVLSPTQELVVALNTATVDLASGYATVQQARQTVKEAMADMKSKAKTQRTAYSNLASLVQTQSGGDAAYILSCGYGVRSASTANPPVVDPPDALRTKVNGTPGNVYLSWTPPTGAQFFEVQSTTDLTGETGWTTAEEMPKPSKATFTGLTSGTRYSFRVRGWGNGKPGPWSTPVQQMVL